MGRKRAKIDPETLRRNVGMRVRWYRDTTPQRAFAEQVGLTQAYLCRIERGEVDLSLSVLQKLAQGMDIPLAVFLEKIETAHQSRYQYGREEILTTAEIEKREHGRSVNL